MISFETLFHHSEVECSGRWCFGEGNHSALRSDQMTATVQGRLGQIYLVLLGLGGDGQRFWLDDVDGATEIPPNPLKLKMGKTNSQTSLVESIALDPLLSLAFLFLRQVSEHFSSPGLILPRSAVEHCHLLKSSFCAAGMSILRILVSILWWGVLRWVYCESLQFAAPTGPKSSQLQRACSSSSNPYRPTTSQPSARHVCLCSYFPRYIMGYTTFGSPLAPITALNKECFKTVLLVRHRQ